MIYFRHPAVSFIKRFLLSLDYSTHQLSINAIVIVLTIAIHSTLISAELTAQNPPDSLLLENEIWTPLGNAVIKTDLQGKNYEKIYDFPPVTVSDPAKKMAELNNELYAITRKGGIAGNGILFKYNLESKETKFLTEIDTAVHGREPVGGLACVGDSVLFTFTSEGGQHNAGVILEYDPDTDSLKSVHHFKPGKEGGTSYSYPVVKDQKIYGLLAAGGEHGYGSLFTYDIISEELTVLHHFDSISGGSPHGSLQPVKNQAGIIYKFTGYAFMGGEHNAGVIFDYDLRNGQYTVALHLDPEVHGSGPMGTPCLTENGKYHGLTSGGGSQGYGMLFSYHPNGTTKIYNDFNNRSYAGYHTITNFRDSLLLIPMRYTALVIETYSDRLNSYGYTNTTSAGVLFSASNGKLYDVTNERAMKDENGFNELDPKTMTHRYVIHFGDSYYGKNPVPQLCQANLTDGLIYGMADGGIHGKGVLFVINPDTKAYRKLMDFNGENGAKPYSGLIQASNGKLYGTTTSGGEHKYYGVLFEYDPTTETFTKLVDFNGREVKGKKSILYEASNGKLYGTSSEGGSGIDQTGYGTLYEYTIGSNSVRILKRFNNLDGRAPYGGVYEKNGVLYGFTSAAGSGDELFKAAGTLYSYDINSRTFNKLRSLLFSHNEYYDPGRITGSFVGWEDKLLAFSPVGGPTMAGTILTYEPSTDDLDILYPFETMGGSTGTPLVASNGKIYGMADKLFSYDPVTSDFTEYYYTQTDPFVYPAPIEIVKCNSYSDVNIYVCGSYTASDGRTLTESGTYYDLIPNQAGCDSVMTIRLVVSHIVGDIDCNAVITGDEVAGDANNNTVIDPGELAGDINGDGSITDGEISGDINGNFIIDSTEFAGDVNGNRIIDSNEAAGDIDGSQEIEEPELLGDINGDYQIGLFEISGDRSGNGEIDGNETLGHVLPSNAVLFRNHDKEKADLYKMVLNKYSNHFYHTFELELSTIEPELNFGDISLVVKYTYGAYTVVDSTPIDGGLLVNSEVFLTKTYPHLGEQEVLRLTASLKSPYGSEKILYNYTEVYIPLEEDDEGGGDNTSVSDLSSELGVMVYPNPFASEVMVAPDPAKTEKYRVRLYDMNGSEVYSSGMLHGERSVIQLPQTLASGSYILKVYFNDSHHSFRLIRQ